MERSVSSPAAPTERISRIEAQTPCPPSHKRFSSRTHQRHHICKRLIKSFLEDIKAGRIDEGAEEILQVRELWVECTGREGLEVICRRVLARLRQTRFGED